MIGTVLIADDDPSFRRELKPRLETQGLHVEEASTGAGALRRLDRADRMVVVVGALLPDMSGIAFVARLRQLRPEVPVVLVLDSVRDQDAFAPLAREVGVTVTTHKPVDGAALAQQMAVLALSRAERSPRSSVAPSHPDPPALPLAMPLPERHFGPASENAPALDPAPATALHSGPHPEFDPELSSELQALAAAYASELPRKLEDISTALTRARTSAEPSSRLEAAQLTHRLRGTAGSYGLPEIGTEAGRIEDALQAEALYRGRTPEPIDWPSVDAALDALRTLVSQAASSVPATVARETTPQPAILANECVLVVDDDPDFLRALMRIGKLHLIDVLSAHSAEEAMMRASQRRPDVVFLDVELAGGQAESFELARRLRELPGGEAMSLAFVSSNAAAHNRIGAARAGASLFLRKPVDGTSFIAAVRQLSALQIDDRPRILIVDQDEAFAANVEKLVREKGMTVEVMPDPLQLPEQLDRTPPAVLLIDWDMHGVSGLDVCRMVRTAPRWQSTPILCVSKRSGLETRLEAFRAGVDDCLQEPLDSEELLARLSVTVERARLLRDRMDRDALTGLLLRRPFFESLSARLSEAQRHGKPLALVLLDLDHFKQVNDERGHLTGDRVLAGLGRLLACSFRAEDLRGRWGGEEFVIAFPGEDASTIVRALERVQQEFAAIDFLDERGKTFNVTFSAGVASAHADGSTVHRLVRVADRRLYAAKRAGRARTVAAD